MTQSGPIAIYVDADACPVKEEVYRVAERHRIKVCVVANAFMAVPRDPWIERVVVGADFDAAADDWIAERAKRGVVVITADVPLAHRCVKAGADVIAPKLTRVHGGFDRDGARHARSHGGPARKRRGHRRPQALLAARPFKLPVGA